MQPENNVSPPPPPGPGLPPVAPPTGSFIVRLFLVPGLIVTLVVVLLIVVRWFLSTSASADSFLKRLDDPNPEVRWRAASDLSQRLLRDEKLASDGAFALQLADRLQRTLAGSGAAEVELAKKINTLSPDQREVERRKLEPERNYIRFLTPCLGKFIVPVGVPVLEEMATRDSGAEPPEAAARQRYAVWALATLGENLKRFDKLKAPDQDAILADLETARERYPHPEWATATIEYLKKRRAGRPDAFGIDRTMAKCAVSEDPSLRYFAAFALNFWEGTPSENAHMEKILVDLSHDDGHGQNLLESFFESDPKHPPKSKEIEKKPGMIVRANATIALARRGSLKVRLGLLQDMLDEAGLSDTFVLEEPGGRVPNKAKVELILTSTLKAVGELHRRTPTYDLSSLRPRIDKLADNSNPDVRNEARQLQAELGPTS